MCFQDAIVGGRLAPLVVLGLQSVDRDHDLQPPQPDPFLRNRAHGARDDLRVDAALGHPRQNLVQLAIADQRLAAHDRHVQRPIPVEQREHAVDELLALEILQLAQLDVAAEVIVAVRVAARTRERALASNFDRQIWLITAKDPSPRPDNTFHG